jgi:hypothetical protein
MEDSNRTITTLNSSITSIDSTNNTITAKSNIYIKFSIPSLWDSIKPINVDVNETFGELKKSVIYSSFNPLTDREQYFTRFEIQLYFIKEDDDIDYSGTLHSKQFYMTPHNDEIISNVIFRQGNKVLGEIMAVLTDLLPNSDKTDHIKIKTKKYNNNKQCTEWISNTNVINDNSTSEYLYEHPSNLLRLRDEMLNEIMNAGLLQGTLEKKITSQSGKIDWIKQYFILTVDRLWYIQDKKSSYIELDFISTCELEEQPIHILGKSCVFSVSYGYSGNNLIIIY